MVWWVLDYTTPRGGLLAKVSLGEIKNLRRSDITIELVDYIRDKYTAATLRQLHGPFKDINEDLVGVKEQSEK